MKWSRFIGIMVAMVGGLLMGAGIATQYEVPQWHWLLSLAMIGYGTWLVMVNSGGDQNGQE